MDEVVWATRENTREDSNYRIDIRTAICTDSQILITNGLLFKICFLSSIICMSRNYHSAVYLPQSPPHSIDALLRFTQHTFYAILQLLRIVGNDAG